MLLDLILSYRQTSSIELSYDKFTELRKKGLVGLTIDNVGSINAAMLGISKSKALNPKRSRMKMRKINRIDSRPF